MLPKADSSLCDYSDHLLLYDWGKGRKMGGLDQMLFVGTFCNVWRRKLEMGILMKLLKFLCRICTPFPISLKKQKLTASFNSDDMGI